MSSSEHKFWLSNICELVGNPNIIPMKDMTTNEKLNATTRLVIVLSMLLFVFGFQYWLHFLGLCVLLIITIKYTGSESENFTVTPTFNSLDFEQTTVAPLFSEEWQIPPPIYDVYDSIPPESPEPEEPLEPRSYPYGQFLTKTNLLPSDEYYTHMACGQKNAREYYNSAYLRNRLAFQDNMMRIYRMKLNKRFRHNCNDTVSPFLSY